MKYTPRNNVPRDVIPFRVTPRRPTRRGPPATLHPLHDRQALLTEGMTLLALAGPDTLARALAALRAL